MKTVKFKDLPEKVREFLQREYAFAFILSDSVELDWLHKINEWSKATDEERLAYAEWKYKDGVTCLLGDLKRKDKISRPLRVVNSQISDRSSNCIYHKEINEWAEIIEEAKPEKEEQPEFKAGDKVTLDGSDANTVFKIIHIEDEMAWIKAEGMMFGRLVMLNRLCKPDPDKVYREIAKEFLREKVYSFDNLEHFTVPKQGLIELVTEAIKQVIFNPLTP